MAAVTLPDGRIPVLLSAHEEELIAADAAAIQAFLAASAAPPERVAATLLRTRRVRRHRAVVRAADTAELRCGLQALADGDDHPLLARASSSAAPRTAFVFPGQGGQWPSMGADTYRLPAYRAEVDRCVAAFVAAGQPSPLPFLLNEGDGFSQLEIQGAQFVHAVGLAQVWRSCGVLPASTVGHSLGEVAAAYVAGTVSLADAVAVVTARAAVLDLLPGRYGMAVLGVGVASAQTLVADTPGWLEVSVVNAPSSTVLSGDRDAVTAVAALAQQRGIFVREIPVEFPAHTSALERLRPALTDLLPDAAFADAPVEFIGSATGAVVPAGTDFGDYWYANLRNTVRFDQAIGAAVRRGTGAFVELSAHPSVQYALGELLDADALSVASTRRDEPVTDELSANIVAAAITDPGYRWADIAGAADAPLLPGFPNAPMRAVHLWATPEPLAGEGGPVILTAAEHWEPAGHPAVAADQTLAIVACDAGGQALAADLSAAADKAGAPIADAEIVVIVAPRVSGGTATPTIPDYTALLGPGNRTVWLLTVGGEQIGDEDPPPLAHQAGLAAVHRCVGFEFPDHRFGHLDVANWALDAETAQLCVAALLGEPAEVAVRGGRRYTRALREHRRPAPALPAAVLSDVVITGGTGALGRRFARYCIEHGARRVVLLSRTGADPATLARLAHGYGAEVLAPVCDITDPEALSTVAAEHAGDGASLLIHAAGVARFGRHDQLTDTDLAAAASKVAGLTAITDRWPLHPEGHIIACSSVSGVWGGLGHAAYAAANRMLDAAVGRLRTAGRRATAVRFGLWQDAGIIDADEIARVQTSGLLAMDPEQAVAATLRCHVGDPLILGADLQRLRIFFENQGSPVPFGTDAEPAGEPDQQPVDAVVRSALAAALSLPESDQVDLNTPLIDLGVDSLLALDLRKRLRRGTGRSIALASLLGGITGAELIAALTPTTAPVTATPDRRESLRD